jgi:YidC/Oxa1 family membrane protein insertase
MNIFDLIVVQPIFNVLMLIYGLIPGADFGIAIILLTILIRLAMWPMVKKQLHQTKVMRAMQPELKKIKAKAKGERGVNPFSTFGLLLLQLPIFIALYQVINLISHSKDNIAKFTYDFIEQIPSLHTIIIDPSRFSESLFGVVNLTRHALDQGVIYWPIMVLAVIAAGLQYVQAKQLAPEVTEKRRLRDLLKEQAAGKEVDQSEVTAIVTSRTLVLFPILTLMIGLYLPGALVLYFVVSSVVAIIQQHIILGQDIEEMEKIADSPMRQRAKAAKTAEVVKQPVATTKAKKRKKKK